MVLNFLNRVAPYDVPTAMGAAMSKYQSGLPPGTLLAVGAWKQGTHRE